MKQILFLYLLGAQMPLWHLSVKCAVKTNLYLDNWRTFVSNNIIVTNVITEFATVKCYITASLKNVM